MRTAPLAAAALIAALGLTLSGCTSTGGASSGSAASSPTEILEAYAAHLNGGRFDDALALVVDTEGVSPDDLATVQQLAIPAFSLRKDEEVEKGADTASLTFDADNAAWGVDFTKTDDGWRLAKPTFLTQNAAVDLATAPGAAVLRASGVPLVLDDGEALPDAPWLVTGVIGDNVLSGTVVFEGNTVWEAHEWPFMGSVGGGSSDLALNLSYPQAVADPVQLTSAAAAPLLAQMERYVVPPSEFEFYPAVWESSGGTCTGDYEAVAHSLQKAAAEVTCEGTVRVTPVTGDSYSIDRLWRFELSSTGEATELEDN